MRKSPSKFETHDDGARWTTSGRVTLDSFFGFWEIDLLGPDNCVGPDGEAHTRCAEQEISMRFPRKRKFHFVHMNLR